MYNGFTKGLIIGGLIGASVSYVLSENTSPKSRKRMMRQGRSMLKRSGHILGNVVDMIK